MIVLSSNPSILLEVARERMRRSLPSFKPETLEGEGCQTPERGLRKEASRETRIWAGGVGSASGLCRMVRGSAAGFASLSLNTGGRMEV